MTEIATLSLNKKKKIICVQMSILKHQKHLFMLISRLKDVMNVITFLPSSLLFQTFIVVRESFKSNTAENGQRQQYDANNKYHLVPMTEYILV